MSSYGQQDHIAITSGNKSTTRREVSVRDAQLLLAPVSLRVILAILIVASGQIRKYCPARSDLCPWMTRPGQDGDSGHGDGDALWRRASCVRDSVVSVHRAVVAP
jgi:hypothetical protein